MAKQVINRGSFVDDPSAEHLYSAFGKVNSNFTELYNAALPAPSKQILVNTAGGVQAAINTLGDRRTLHWQQLGNAITVDVATEPGYTLVTGTGTTWNGGVAILSGHVRVGDLLKFTDEDRYYLVDRVDSDTQIRLAEPYLGAKTTGTYAFDMFYIDWAEVVLAPGEYTAAYFDMLPGIILRGMDRNTCRIGENSGTPGVIFNQFGANVLRNLNITPVRSFSDVDGLCRMQSGSATYDDDLFWAGIVGGLEDCNINATNSGGAHHGGITRFPATANSKTFIDRCYIEYDEYGSFNALPGTYPQTLYTDRTVVKLRNCIFQPTNSWSNSSGFTLLGGTALAIDSDPITVECYFCDFPEFDRDIDTLTAAPHIVGIAHIQLAAATGAVLRMHGCRGRVVNSGTATSCIARADVACTMEFFGCDFETDDYGIWQTNFGVNTKIRNSRIKGVNNSITNTGFGPCSVDCASTIDGLIVGPVVSENGLPSVYGSMRVKDGAVDQTGIGGTAVKLTCFDTSGPFNHTIVNTASDVITPGLGGDYKIEASLSFSGPPASGGVTFDFEIYVGNTATGVKGRRKLGTGGDVGSCTFADVISVGSQQAVEVRVSCDDIGKTIRVEQAQLLVIGV